MITSTQFASLQINRVIFHDVPHRIREGAGQPTLSDVQTEIDATRAGRLKTKLIRVLGSSRAYPVCFDPGSTSPVPPGVRSLTLHSCPAAEFVTDSQRFANHLFGLQHGGISSGLLCVLEVAAGGMAGMVLMKLEREEGARVELSEVDGKKTFEMSVIDNLVLTDGTRLFKSAIFLRAGEGEDDFEATACDSQLNVTASDEMAKFWLRFLGCTFLIEPRVATERFYDSSVEFINQVITDPVHKNDLYAHLHSQLKSGRKKFSPKKFIEDYVPQEYHKHYREFLESKGVPLTTFDKDLADIKGHLRRWAYITPRGAVVSAPADEEGLVEVDDRRIIVNDTVAKVDHK